MTVSQTRSNTAPLTPEMIAAWRRLFTGEDVVVTADRGLFLRGGALDVVVSVWESEGEAGHFDAHITAFVPGGRRVRLDEVTVHARAADGAGVLVRVGEGTARGDLAIRGMKRGLSYALHSPAVAEQGGRVAAVAAPVAAPKSVSHSLLEQVGAQDAGAWSQLVKLFMPLVYHWCRSAGLPEDDAALVAPQVFQLVRQRLADFRSNQPRSSFRAWLRGLATEALDEFLRRQGRSTVARVDTWITPQPGSTPSSEADLDLLMGPAFELVRDRFDPVTREVGQRLLVQGESPEQVALALNQNPGQVQRLRESVLQVLQEEMGELIA